MLEDLDDKINDYDCVKHFMSIIEKHGFLKCLLPREQNFIYIYDKTKPLNHIKGCNCTTCEFMK